MVMYDLNIRVQVTYNDQCLQVCMIVTQDMFLLLLIRLRTGDQDGFVLQFEGRRESN